MKRKFIFLYLDTGGGHKAPAGVLKSAILEAHPDAEVELMNGFGRNNLTAHIFIEKGYHTACNYAPGAFSLIYEVSKFRPIQNLISQNIKPITVPYLKKQFRDRGVTDVVCFHFALTPSAVTAIRQLGGSIRFSCVVTDPFTVPTVWFYEHNIHYYVYTEQARQYAISRGIPPENVTVCPFLINKKFIAPVSGSDTAFLRKKHGLPLEKPLVLIAGGGEGLPGTIQIIAQYIKTKPPFAVAVVCGRDKKTRQCLKLIKIANPHIDLHIFGFVQFMDELVKACDCTVTKAGTSTLIEMLKSRKPVVISTYIHGQELGNVQFAVKNGVGWFIQKPAEIIQKITELISDKDYYTSVLHRLSNLTIDTNATRLAEMVWEQGS